MRIAQSRGRYNRAMSSPLSVDVLPLEKKDRGRAGGVLARAFYDTDQWAALFPDQGARQRQLEQMFGGTGKLIDAAGGVAERTPNFEAVAFWLPPGRSVGFWAMLKSGFASARFAVTPPFPNTRRLMASLRQFEVNHKRLMPHPHWYLMALGVDPADQRGGFGSALVRHGLARAESESQPVYVEAETAATAPFYEKLGFEVVEVATIEPIAVPFSFMIRPPERTDT